MDFAKIFEQIQGLYRKLNLKQKLVILGTILAVVLFVTFLIVYDHKKDGSSDGYKVLFDNLSSKDAALIVQQLQQDKVAYKIQNENTILVPDDVVYEERIKIASLGIPKDSGVDFSLFDKQEFGATDFDQRVKYLRALEGELEKTISSLRPIEKSKVQIAIPKETVFVANQTPPTASVVLTMKPNMTLSPKQVMGIKNLVASSVPKMTAENVRIVDENGEPLGENDDTTTSRELAQSQLKYKKELERTYEEKIVKILSPFIGGDERVVAKVTMEFDFAQKQSTQEQYDPNNVMRSEQNMEEKREGFRPKEIGGVPGAVSNIGPVQGLDEQNLKEKYEKNQNTVNYEVSKITSSIKGEFAVVKRISAAVVVDGKYKLKDDGDGLQYIALAQEEMTKIDSLVRQAIGFNVDRSDQVTVSNFEFGAKGAMLPKSMAEKLADSLREFMGPFWPMLKYLLAGFILLIFYVKVIKPFIERMQLVPIEEDEEKASIFDVEDEEEEDTLNKFNELRRKVEDQLGIRGELNEEEVKYEILLEKIKEMIGEKPEEVASLFQALVRDDLGLEAAMPRFDQGSKASD